MVVSSEKLHPSSLSPFTKLLLLWQYIRPASSMALHCFTNCTQSKMNPVTFLYMLSVRQNEILPVYSMYSTPRKYLPQDYFCLLLLCNMKRKHIRNFWFGIKRVLIFITATVIQVVTYMWSHFYRSCSCYINDYILPCWSVKPCWTQI